MAVLQMPAGLSESKALAFEFASFITIVTEHTFEISALLIRLGPFIRVCALRKVHDVASDAKHDSYCIDWREMVTQPDG